MLMLMHSIHAGEVLSILRAHVDMSLLQMRSLLRLLGVVCNGLPVH